MSYLVIVGIISLMSLPSLVFAEDSFLGIPFGEKLAVEECAKGTYIHENLCSYMETLQDRKRDQELFKEPNLEPNDVKTYKFEKSWEGLSVTVFVPMNAEIHDLLKDGSISVNVTKNGIVEGISFATTGYKVQEEVLKLLVRKYGKPSSQGKRYLRNAFNTKYQGIYANWKFKNYEILFKGVESDDLDCGVARIKTKEFQKFLDTKLRTEKTKKLKL